MNRIILNETSYFGAGCRSVIAVEAARRGFKKAFFVTDKDLIKFGVAAEIIKVFDENQIVAAAKVNTREVELDNDRDAAVSYTHLTLPTT